MIPAWPLHCAPGAGPACCGRRRPGSILAFRSEKSVNRRATSNKRAFHRGGGITMCKHRSLYTHSGIAAIVLASMLSTSIDARAADDPPAIASAKAAWRDGSARYDFVMDEQTLSITPASAATDDKAGGDAQARCILVVPKKAASRQPMVLARPSPQSSATGRNRVAREGVPSRLHHARAGPAARCLARLPDREASIVPQAGRSSA